MPKSSEISEMKTDENSFANLVYSNVNKYREKNKAVKKTLTIPQWLNEEAEKRHINFSSILKEALYWRIKELENL